MTNIATPYEKQPESHFSPIVSSHHDSRVGEVPKPPPPIPQPTPAPEPVQNLVDTVNSANFDFPLTAAIPDPELLLPLSEFDPPPPKKVAKPAPPSQVAVTQTKPRLRRDDTKRRTQLAKQITKRAAIISRATPARRAKPDSKALRPSSFPSPHQARSPAAVSANPAAMPHSTAPHSRLRKNTASPLRETALANPSPARSPCPLSSLSVSAPSPSTAHQRRLVETSHQSDFSPPRCSPRPRLPEPSSFHLSTLGRDKSTIHR